MFSARFWLIGAAVLFPFYISIAEAFWRLQCGYRSGLARLDPLISPGGVSEHVHAIHGGSAFSSSSTGEDLLKSNCTSCQVTKDRSAYWTPALYFMDSSGNATLVEEVPGFLAYYDFHGGYDSKGNVQTIEAFPNGFQMISGNTYQRNFSLPVPDPPQPWPAEQKTQFALAQKALGFNCLNYNAAAEPSLYRHFLPDKSYLDANCPQGVRFELMFPSCWNGELDSPNHKDHVAFPDQVLSGNCPEGYDRRLISLFYETIWNTAAFVGQEGQFVLANGDPTGYGYHGDFIAAWDDNLLFDAANNSVCNNPGGSGVTSDCPLFDIQPSASMSACSFTAMPTAIVAENVQGPRTGLPGNVAIQSGPVYATRATTANAYQLSSAASAGAASTSAVVPTLQYTSATTSSADAAFYQAASSTSTGAYGAGFYQMGSSSSSSSAASTPSPTSESATSAAAAAASSSSSPSSPAPTPTSASVESSYVASSSAAAAAAPATSATVTSAPYVDVNAQVVQPAPVATSYWTEGGDAYEMIVVAETVTVTHSAAGEKKKRHLHRHLGRHHGGVGGRR